MHYHQYLYHKRWSVETKYGELKTRVRLENFSGKNPQAIRQELYAALFISNLSALIKSSTENEIREELNRGRHRYQLNRSYIIGAVSRYIRCLINIRCYKDKLQQLIQHAKLPPTSIFFKFPSFGKLEKSACEGTQAVLAMTLYRLFWAALINTGFFQKKVGITFTVFEKIIKFF